MSTDRPQQGGGGVRRPFFRRMFQNVVKLYLAASQPFQPKSNVNSPKRLNELVTLR